MKTHKILANFQTQICHNQLSNYWATQGLQKCSSSSGLTSKRLVLLNAILTIKKHTTSSIKKLYLLFDLYLHSDSLKKTPSLLVQHVLYIIILIVYKFLGKFINKNLQQHCKCKCVFFSVAFVHWVQKINATCTKQLKQSCVTVVV